MPETSVTSAEFQKNFGRYKEIAIREPVTITNHGRDSLVLLSAEEYRKMLKQYREALYVWELSPQELHDIATAKIPDEARQFDDEVE